MEEYEDNSLFDGKLICRQNLHGYRFSIDAVLLAHFVTVKKKARMLDLGTGSGIISLILLYRHYSILTECSGVELQESLAYLAKENIERNNFDSKSVLYQCDVRSLPKHIKAEAYDIIVCNPPFYPAKTGRINSNDEARLARHQIAADLTDFLKGASFAVKNRGNCFFIYPAELVTDFIDKSKRTNFELKKLRFIYSYPQSDKGAQLVLLQCMKNGGVGVEVLPPLYIYKEKNGEYTDEVYKFYKG